MEAQALELTLITALLVSPLRRILIGVTTQTKDPNAEAKLSSEHTSTRLAHIDVLKGLAILAVLLIHSADRYKAFHLSPIAAEQALSLPNLLISICRFGVPFFLICSGALLSVGNQTDRSLTNFYWRKLKRIGVPYLVCCSIIALYYQMDVSLAVRQAVTGTICVPYYFVVLLIQLYLLYPFLSHFAARSWFLPLSLFISVVTAFSAEAGGLGAMLYAPRYLYFFAYGMHHSSAIRTGQPGAFKTTRQVCLAMLLIFFIFYALFPGAYSNYRFVYAIALFNLLLIQLGTICRWSSAWWLLRAIGQRSLWIFLTHYAVVSWVFGLQLRTGSNTAMALILGIAAISLSIVLGTLSGKMYSWLLRKV